MVLEASSPGDNIIEMIRPEIYISTGMLDKAEERLNELTQKNSGNYFAWEKLLFIYLQKEDFINLEKKAEICSRTFNRSFIAKVLYATAAGQNNKFDIALEELRKAEILAGDNKELGFQVKAQRADTYYRMKDYDQAFSAFEEALKMNSGDLTLLNNYAYYLSEQNLKLKEAEAMAKKVIEQEPENNTYLDTYAWVLYKRGKLKQAEDIMEKILKSGDLTDAEFYEHYGYILAKLKNCDKAIGAWRKAIQLDNKKQELEIQIENCKK
jgi:tetratricopeptide (TPR) repeat protein